jgi:hypothetical protein
MPRAVLGPGEAVPGGFGGSPPGSDPGLATQERIRAADGSLAQLVTTLATCHASPERWQ